MKLITNFLLIFSILVFSGCAAVQTYYDPGTGIHQIHAYDNSFLNTSSKLSQYQQCDKNKEQPENCKPLGMYHSDTTGLLPSIGGQAIQGIAIGIGLEASDDVVNTVGGNTVIDQSCRGNCGGGPK